MFLPTHFCRLFFINMQERFMLAVGNISNQRRPSCAALWKGPLEGRPVNAVVGLQPPLVGKNKNASGTPSGFVVALGFSVIFPVAPSKFLFVWGLSPLLTCREPYKGFPFFAQGHWAGFGAPLASKEHGCGLNGKRHILKMDQQELPQPESEGLLFKTSRNWSRRPVDS